MLYEAVIFDLDGTLTDSREGIVKSTEYALDKMNCPVPPESTLQRFLGPPLTESFMKYCGMNEEDAVRCLGYYRELYVPEGWRMNRVYPGIRKLLRELKKRGCYIAVATGKPQRMSERIIAYFGLSSYIDALAGPDENEAHADKCQLIRKVLPAGKKALMVGDTAGDILGAKQAGTDSCAALWGYGENSELLALSPELRACTAEELMNILCPDAVQDTGVFISFEGVDGCGKTTQMHRVRERLEKMGYQVTVSREPGGCPLSEQIRGMLLAKQDNGMTAETEALLFAAARAQHVHDVILPAVKEGRIMLCDRFIDSSIVYQGFARGLGEEWVRLINRSAREVCAPDKTIYLRMDHREALRRRGIATDLDRIEQQGEAFFSDTEKAYEHLCEAEPSRLLPVNGNGTVEEVEERVFAAVQGILAEKGL